MEFAFTFERLDVYRLSVENARYFRAVRWPPGTTHLRDQATRAADSVVLNLTEAFGRTNNARRNHFRIALGSAGEAFAVLDVVDLPEGAARQQKLRRVAAMLHRLSVR